MEQTYKTEGIILKRWSFKEHDRMVRLYTKDFGKITTRAISVRKPLSKLAGHLEPFIVSDLFLARSKTIDIIAGSRTIHSHASLRQSALHAAIAAYVAEIIDRVTQEQEQDERLYEHIVQLFGWLSEHDANMLVVYGGITQLFGLLGYHTEWYRCHQCKRLVREEGSKFHFKLWNVECNECVNEDHTLPLTNESIKVLRFLHEQPMQEAAKLQLTEATWVPIHEYMRLLLQYNIDYPIKSEAVVVSLLRQLQRTSVEPVAVTAAV